MGKKGLGGVDFIMNMEKVSLKKSIAHKNINQYLSEYSKLPDPETYSNLEKIAEEIDELELRFFHVNKAVENHHLKTDIEGLIKQLRRELEESSQKIVTQLRTLVLMNETMHVSTKKGHKPYILYEEKCKNETKDVLMLLNKSVSKVDILYFNLIRADITEVNKNKIDDILQEFEIIFDDLTTAMKSGHSDTRIKENYIRLEDTKKTENSESTDNRNVACAPSQPVLVESTPSSPSNLFYKMFVSEMMLANKISAIISKMHDGWPTINALSEESTILHGIAETLQIRAEVLRETRAEKEGECLPFIKEFYAKDRTDKEWKKFREVLAKILLQLKKDICSEVNYFEELMCNSISKLRKSKSDAAKCAVSLADYAQADIEKAMKENNISMIRPQPHERFNHVEHEIYDAVSVKNFNAGDIVDLLYCGYKQESDIFMKARVSVAK